MHNRRVKGGGSSPARAGVVAAGLLIVLGALSARHLFRAPSESAAAGAPPAPSPVDAPAGQQARPKVEVDWSTTLTGDPFSSQLVFPPKPAVAPEPAPPQSDKAEELTQVVRRTIKLTGTFLGSHPLAIMNGKMYHTGDRIDGFLVRQIGAREVVLEKDGVQIVLAEKEAAR
jgi:hypothetical protein